MKIGNILLKNNLILAPMAGVSDVGFRKLAIDFGADFASLEMISAKALTYNNKKTLKLLETHDSEKILVAQIFGNDPDIMAKVVAGKSLEKFDIIDINMGCPAPKITSNFEGSSLMKNISLAEEIITKCTKATTKPITVKFRSGWDSDSVNAVEFALMCQRAGASAITIHGRTKAQGYSGGVDYDIIRRVKLSVTIPVIGNGDVVDAVSYNMMKETGVDAVMIGRGALGNPEIFSKLLNIDIEKPKIDIIKEHISILKQYHDDRFIIKHIRKHILWYLKGYMGASKIKVDIMSLLTLEDLVSELETFFKNK